MPNFVDVSGGASHSLARTTWDEVYAWGLNTAAQPNGVPLGSNAGVAQPVKDANGSVVNADAISAGGTHSLLLSVGAVYAWGANANGQLGQTVGTVKSVPTLVPSLPTIVAIAAGGQHSMALDNQGAVWVWGSNVYGQCGNGSTQATGGIVTPYKAISSGIIAIAAGAQFSMALDADGNVWTWGRNHQGQLGQAGTSTTLGNRTTATMITPTADFTRMVSISAGSSAIHALAIKADGTVWSWGYNGTGQLGNGLVETTARLKAPAKVLGLMLNGYRPQVSIRTPVAGAVFAGPANVAVEVAASDSDGIARVDLYGDGVLVASDNASPFRLVWPNVTSNGAHSLQALAVDTTGAFSWSAPVSITVNAAGGSTVADPLPSQQPGLFYTGQELALTSPTVGAAVRYTLDGTDPTNESPALAGNEVLWLDRSTTVKARAFLSGYAPSRIFTGRYRIVGGAVAGANFATAITTGARMYAWGDNGLYQLIGEAGPDRQLPMEARAIEPAVPIVAFTAGATHTLALKSDGTLFAWGSAVAVGRGQTGGRLASLVDGNKYVTAAAGTSHTLAVLRDGRVVAWGANAFGQLGNGSDVAAQIPYYVNNLSGVIGVAAGTGHSLAVCSDGAVWAWGKNSLGQLGIGTLVEQHFPVKVTAPAGVSFVRVATRADTSYALTADGQVYAWGAGTSYALGGGGTSQANQTTPQLVQGLSGLRVVDVAAGALHALACTDDGSAYIWGSNVYGQNGMAGGSRSTATKLPNVYNVVRVSAGDNFSLVTTETGMVLSWGWNANGQLGNNTVNGLSTNYGPFQVLGLSLMGNFTIATGDYFSLGLRNDGLVWSWGRPDKGRLGYPATANVFRPTKIPGLRNVIDLAANVDRTLDNAHSLAATSGGAVYAWGANPNGELGDGTQGSTAFRDTPYEVTGFTSPITRVAAGATFSAAQDVDGALWWWGRKPTGRHWVTTPAPAHYVIDYENVLTPQKVATYNPGVGMLSAGRAHVAILTEGLGVEIWGDNDKGQLGTGDTSLTFGTAYVSGFPAAIAVACGDDHTIILKPDGTVWAWGANDNGQLGDNTALTRYAPVQVKYSSTTAPVEGPQTTVANLTGVVAIGATGNTSYAVKVNGDVYAWGQNKTTDVPLTTVFGSDTITRSAVYAAVKSSNAVPSYVKVARGSDFAAGLRYDGQVATWGGNTYDQRADDYPTARNTAKAIDKFDLLFSDDPDGDGLTTDEEFILKTDPLKWDTNGDGLQDGASLAAGFDPLSNDSDGDGLSNATEIALGTNPFWNDSDGDGVLDGADAFPLDPTRWAAPSGTTGDVTPPTVTLTEPANAVLVP